jgi:hypothetical protein
MATRAIVQERPVTLYSDPMLMQPTGRQIPVQTELALLQADKSAVAVALADGTQGYISPDTQVKCLQQVVLLDETATAYAAPTQNSARAIQFAKGHEFWIGGTAGDGIWVEVHDRDQRTAYASGDMKVLFVDKLREMAAQSLASGRSPDRVLKDLEKAGLPPHLAASVRDEMAGAVAQAAQDPEVRRTLASKYARHMLYGVLWTVGGTVATVLGYQAASDGGTYMIFWGAIVFGIIDFARGLAGWAKYSS